MDCLRSFVAVAELGSFSHAANRVGRSASAISLQMDRLGSQAGIPLFEKVGRHNIITPIGSEFFEHARAILAQNDAALQLATVNKVSGLVRLGVVQDFAEDVLPHALNSLSKQFQNIRIEVLVERSRVLLDLLERNELDQAIAFRHDTDAVSTKLKSAQMIWLGKQGHSFDMSKPLPLVLVEGPCLFRKAALKSLGKAGLSWEIKLTSPSLACVTAAAEAGIGLAVRTTDLLRRKQATLSNYSQLPSLPDIDLHIYNSSKVTNPAADKLVEYWVQQLASFPAAQRTEY